MNASAIIDVDMIAAKFGGKASCTQSTEDGAETIEYTFKTLESSRRFNEAVQRWLKETERGV